MNKKFKIAATGLMLAGAMGVAQQAQAFQIDTFDDGAQFTSSTGVLSSDAGVVTSAVGGYRAVTVLRDSGGGAVSAYVDTGTFFHDDPGSGRGTSTITWDANDGGGVGLNSADITDTGASQWIKFAITNYDLGALQLSFKVTDMTGDIATLTKTNAQLGVLSTITFGNPVVDVYFPFTDFANKAATDFTDVKSIELTIVANANATDLGLDLIETSGNPPSAPEPATLGLMGLGIVGFAAFRKRKQA